MKSITRWMKDNGPNLLLVAIAVVLGLWVDPLAATFPMMALSTAAQSAQGMTLQMSPAGSPELFLTIPELKNINGPTGAANEIDVTDLSSTGKEYKLGLKDFGDITADGFYIADNTTHRALKAAFSDGVVRKFRLTFTDTAPATIWEFQGYIKTFSITAGVDQVVGMNLAVRTTGDITEYN